MANTIILKKSSTASAVPAVGDLQPGELAVNLADQKLYSKTTGGTVILVGSGLGVTSVTGTSPVVSSGGATPAISLASGYGDTQNPYASKTANFVLAAPNGSAGVPTFRAVVAADIPTLNQNTTGSAATLTTGRTIAITGDLTYTSPTFDGSTNVTAAGTLATVNANLGSFTNASVTVNAKGLITAVSSGTGGAGTVTSVGATVPSLLSISGSPITTSGTLAITYSGTALPIANGGTAQTSFTNNYIHYGSFSTSSGLTYNGTDFVCGGNVSAYSDERVKTNWRDLPSDFIDQLVNVKHGIFDRTDNGITQVGVGAQSLAKVLSQAVIADENNQLSVAYGNAALIAVIELSKRVLQLENLFKEYVKNNH